MNNIENKKLQVQKELEALKDKERNEFAGDRDQAMLQHILEKDSDLKLERNVTFKNPNIPWADTDKYKVVMIMPPLWSITFPPYNVAKLTALMRQHGYSVKVYDVNVESYFYLLEHHGQNYWRPDRHFLWAMKENFEKYLLPDLIPLLDKVINEVIESDAKVVGFSLYTTSRIAAGYMAKKIRKARPDICILAGGPETITNEWSFFDPAGDYYDLYNYIFQGESEDNLIHLLDNLPDVLPMNERIGDIKSRLKLDDYPYADYSDYDIRNYTEHGVSIETSRGCIAQCSFCAETYFWKFRTLSPARVVDEIEHYVNTYKVKRIWFVDSLANGNLKVFKELIDILYERKLGIRWHTMARCDGRMDYLFIRKAVATGCTALAFGVETGSQKVLDDMKKKVEVWEIEDNLRDCKKAGTWNHVSWMFGFPTEEPVDYFHSLQVFYNVRKWLAAVSVGYTCQIAKASDIETNTKLYNIASETNFFDYTTLFLNQWYTADYKNTVVNRYIRLKFGYIWFEIMKEYRNSIIVNTQLDHTLKNVHYTINPKEAKNVQDYIEQDFNVNFDQFTGLSGSIANEYVAICYLLYKYFNRLTFTLKFSPELDMPLFGDYLVREYTADVFFEVDKRGNYTFIVDHKLSHTTPYEHLQEQYEKERQRCDMSFDEKIEKRGHISEWQTVEPIVRETIHEQYKRNKN